MNSLNASRTINPTPDELLAAYDAFGELPKMDVLPRLIMVRRAVAAGFYTDNLRVLSTKQIRRRPRRAVEGSTTVTKVRRPSRTSSSNAGDAHTDGVL
jgi:hypothetical protein